ncbi:cytosol aminopeptidase family, catalytic domain-containing protein [Scenedesmus sp. NREL 46B-D3]|nr:cytosol aminopeptidase family, catalytic domain-containing protein [Scenedesmus sp. NREL 46B-D3]
MCMSLMQTSLRLGLDAAIYNRSRSFKVAQQQLGRPSSAANRRRAMSTAFMASATPVLTVPSFEKVAFEPESLPSVSVVSDAPASWAGDLLAVAVAEEDLTSVGGDDSNAEKVVSIKSGALSSIDKQLQGALSELLSGGDFEAKQGSASRALRLGKPAAAAAGPRYVALLGLGKADGLAKPAEECYGANPYQAAGVALAKLAKAEKVSSAGLALLSAPQGTEAQQEAAKRLAAGVLSGCYESVRFKSKAKAAKLAALHMMGLGGSQEQLDAALQAGAGLASGSFMTRYLVEAPPNVLDAAACADLGMGCYLGVAEASLQPPAFIHLTYKPQGEAKKKVAIVGKGLTFDSGGYNLKAGPGSMIELMKFDMGGAAATLGAARILATTQPEGVEVHFIIAACENMVHGKGLRPGDVLKSAHGKTVEVNNTDAEGRLTLADALWYAQEKAGATAIVDIATLTGACIIALGGEVAGLFTPSDAMAAGLSAASNAAGEKLWRMPMEASYAEQLKSSVADMKNTGGRAGGSITAALFLKEFVKKGVEWAHLDIAGPVWDEKASLPTGYGAALLAQWATKQGA